MQAFYWEKILFLNNSKDYYSELAKARESVNHRHLRLADSKAGRGGEKLYNGKKRGLQACPVGLGRLEVGPLEVGCPVRLGRDAYLVFSGWF